MFASPFYQRGNQIHSIHLVDGSPCTTQLHHRSPLLKKREILALGSFSAGLSPSSAAGQMDRHQDLLSYWNTFCSSPPRHSKLIGFFGQVCPPLLLLINSSHFCQRDFLVSSKKSRVIRKINLFFEVKVSLVPDFVTA
jgi:hypothetical protein